MPTVLHRIDDRVRFPPEWQTQRSQAADFRYNGGMTPRKNWNRQDRSVVVQCGWILRNPDSGRL